MRQRGDMEALHEPFGEAWYQGEDPLWPRFKEGDVTTPGLTLKVSGKTSRPRQKKAPCSLKIFSILHQPYVVTRISVELHARLFDSRPGQNHQQHL